MCALVHNGGFYITNYYDVASGDRIAVCDFGIARDLESATDALLMTTVHEAAMTPAYAAPEQRPGAGKHNTNTRYA